MFGKHPLITVVGLLLPLLAGSNAAPAQSICQPDPLGIKGKPQMVQAASGMKIELARIRFQACNRQSFNTAMVGATITINYPADIKSVTGALGALTHELAHAFQLSRAGSMAALKQRLNGSSERMELGADFIAGFVFRHYVSGASRADFQTSVALVGEYDDPSGASHGTPEERNAAFRTGYYYRGPADDVDAADRYFQRDGFGLIKAQNR